MKPANTGKTATKTDPKGKPATTNAPSTASKVKSESVI